MKAVKVAALAAGGLTPADLQGVQDAIDREHKRLADEASSNEPPRVLSNEPTSPYYRPDLLRVGVKIDGVERTNIAFYDADNGAYTTIGGTKHTGAVIEPFWRYNATRQQRRALERWKAKHAK